ncbi:MAG: glutamate--tRNA ligase [Thermofilum sp. ex4484_15]|nr:MAG: glutamate--tRNA ligase [Thermofilum sp. ex4484_15]
MNGYVRLARELAFKYALANAVKFGGKAKVEAVLSKVFAEKPELRALARSVVSVVREVVNEVNAMGLEKQKRILEERWPSLLERKSGEEVKGLPPLPNAERYKLIKTRFAPNPDFVLTLGNARPAILSYEYARRYRGKFVLRFEDTDPKTKRPLREAYELIKEDLRWLGLKWDEEYVQSLRMEIYYKYIRKLLSKGNAYVCTCSYETIRENRVKGVRCEHANLSPEESLELWDRMLEGYFGEGEAVVRVKTDLKHPDPSVRDWIAFRIIDTSKYPHPIVGDKYIIWPTYNFACAVDDHEMGITHILRAKEHITNTVKQGYIYSYLNWEPPEAIHFGRINLEGLILSKSWMRKGIEEGAYESWDDIRLGTLRALRRRGIVPETIWEIVLDVGVKPSGATIKLANLHAINRKYLEPTSDRYMFVLDPLRASIEYDKELKAKLLNHPSYPERGFREIVLKPVNGSISIYLDGRDADYLTSGKEFRLMGLGNVKVIGRDGGVILLKLASLELEEAKRRKLKVLQWVPSKGNVKVEVLKANWTKPPTLDVIRGLGEGYLVNLRPGDTVQFVRFGFVKVEEVKDGYLKVVYAHE